MSVHLYTRRPRLIISERGKRRKHNFVGSFFILFIIFFSLTKKTTKWKKESKMKQKSLFLLENRTKKVKGGKYDGLYTCVCFFFLRRQVIFAEEKRDNFFEWYKFLVAFFLQTKRSFLRNIELHAMCGNRIGRKNHDCSNSLTTKSNDFDFFLFKEKWLSLDHRVKTRNISKLNVELGTISSKLCRRKCVFAFYTCLNIPSFVYKGNLHISTKRARFPSWKFSC